MVSQALIASKKRFFIIFSEKKNIMNHKMNSGSLVEPKTVLFVTYLEQKNLIVSLTKTTRSEKRIHKHQT